MIITSTILITLLLKVPALLIAWVGLYIGIRGVILRMHGDALDRGYVGLFHNNCRPIISCILAIKSGLFALLPGSLGHFFGNGSLTIIIYDLVVYPVTKLMNLPILYLNRHKRVKGTLQVLSGALCACVGYYFHYLLWADNLASLFYKSVVLLVNQVGVGFILFGLIAIFAVVLSNRLLSWVVPKWKQSKDRYVQKIPVAFRDWVLWSVRWVLVSYAAIAFLLFVPMLKEIIILAVPTLWLSVAAIEAPLFAMLSFSFIGMLVSKYLVSFCYYLLLGHSNADGLGFMNKDHWFSKFLGLRARLEQANQVRWKNCMPESITDPSALFKAVLALRLEGKAALDKALSGSGCWWDHVFSYMARYQQYMKAEHGAISHLINAPLACLVTMRTKADGMRLLRICKHWFDHKDSIESSCSRAVGQGYLEVGSIARLLNEVPGVVNITGPSVGKEDQPDPIIERANAIIDRI